MKITYPSEIGVSEVEVRTLNKAKKIIGTADENGDTIGMVDINLRVFQKLSMILALIFLMPVLFGFFFQTPFSWLPIEDQSSWLFKVKVYQLFTLWGWIFAVISYVILCAALLLKNNLYSGVEGAYILFARHGEIVKTLSPGQMWINYDWRITPEFVVSSKYIMLNMDRVEAKEKNNITMNSIGALMARIKSADDAYKLVSMGGWRPLIKKITTFYKTSLSDMIKDHDANEFNTFLVEPIHGAETHTSDDDKLQAISKENLSVELIAKLARINTIDVSTIDLSEDGGLRNSVLPFIQRGASEYGVTLLDHVPIGNGVSEEFLGTKIIKLVIDIERLKQAAGNLYDIKGEEWDEEINMAVSEMKIGASKIDQLITEIDSLMKAMVDDSNVSKIIEEKTKEIEFLVTGIIEPRKKRLEALQNNITSKTVDMTSLELYVSEMEAFHKSLTKERIDALVSPTTIVYTDGKDPERMKQKVDPIGTMLKITGLQDVFDKFKGEVDEDGQLKTDEGQSLEEITKVVEEIEKEANAVDVGATLDDMQKKLDDVPAEPGIDISRFSLESVKEIISDIKEQADVQTDDDESGE